MKAIGLMSGTSLDGLDIALCNIEGSYLDTKISLLDYDEVKLPKELKEKIMKACLLGQANVADICSLNFEIGQFFGDSVKQFLKQRNISSNEIEYIASHGQTIYHIPFSTDQYHASTLQIGESSEIAYRTNIQVISDFRTMDMAAGGQGAPLVPYADYILFHSATITRVLLNIGGISNVTYLPKNCKEENIEAFDTGPGNMMIDEAMRMFYQKEYDEDGTVGRIGHVNQTLLAELMAIPYVHQVPPKSTGRELYGKQKVMELIQKYEMPKEDFVCTFTEYTAKTISSNIQEFLNPKGNVDELIISGGGAHNSYLKERIQAYLPQSKVITQEDLGYSSDAKEAIAFVILGNETLHHHYSNMIYATGAQERVVLGKITPKPLGGIYE